MKRFYIFTVIFLISVVTSLSVGPVWANGDETHETEQTQSVKQQSPNGTHDDTDGRDTKETADHHGTSKVSTDEGHTDQHDQSASEDAEHHESSQQSGLLKTLLPGLTGAPNIHPMVVHFPIVFIVTAFLFSTGSWFWKPDFFRKVARWMFWLGLVSLPITVATGFLAVGGWGGGHNAIHRNLMLLTTLLAFVLFAVLRYVSNRQQLYQMVMTAGLLIVLVFMSLGADRGAWLVYVEGSGVKSVEHTNNH